MTTRKDKIICPWCGAEKMRRWFDEFGQLTALQYQAEKIDTTCDACGKRFEVRAEECVYYKTRRA